MKTRILVVDDQIIVRQGLKMIITAEPTMQVVGEAKDGQEAIRQVESLRPDVVLMDLPLSPEEGMGVIAKIKHIQPAIKVIILTIVEDSARINAAIEAGADGYLLKDADSKSLLQAIEAVQRNEMPLHPRVAHHLFKSGLKKTDLNGHKSLTEREKEVLQLVAKGLSNKIIAQTLSVSEGTIKIHLSNIMDKLSVSSRTEAAVRASQAGLITPDDDLA